MGPAAKAAPRLPFSHASMLRIEPLRVSPLRAWPLALPLIPRRQKAGGVGLAARPGANID